LIDLALTVVSFTLGRPGIRLPARVRPGVQKQALKERFVWIGVFGLHFRPREAGAGAPELASVADEMNGA
jgi:hypothetical protein